MENTTEIFAKLAAPFPMDAVSWRAQSLTQDGTKALALAYIDARDVMRRLDEAVGPQNWQDSFVVATGGRVLCTIQVRVNGEWVSKTDGAGDTKVEAEKGAISDAFKRAAVKWGVGRYLYDLTTPWVPCESYQSGNKLVWKRWKDDPWKHIPHVSPKPAAAPKPSAVTKPAPSRAPEPEMYRNDEPGYMRNVPPVDSYDDFLRG